MMAIYLTLSYSEMASLTIFRDEKYYVVFYRFGFSFLVKMELMYFLEKMAAELRTLS